MDNLQKNEKKETKLCRPAAAFVRKPVQGEIDTLEVILVAAAVSQKQKGSQVFIEFFAPYHCQQQD